MYVRIILAVIVLAIDTIGAGPGKTRKKPDRIPALVQRDGIIRAVFLANPTWSGNQVLAVVAPKMAEAGLTPISLRRLNHELLEIARECGIRRRWCTMSAGHTAFLKDQFAKDPTPSTAAAWARFCAAWGPDAEDRDRVVRWWRIAVRRANAKRRRALAGAPGRQSPTTESASDSSNLPREWWNLSEDFFDEFLASDPDANSMRAAARHPPRPPT